ncbi:MAG: ParB/RepB/Spo0J family partition protein [Lachnospiraceae bacterium]|nr:ParB/RepB/Spo0J family partition protein [Lachnospiraceae bacterium]
MARGLGKGIDVLIPQVENSTEKKPKAKEVVKEVVKEVIRETNEVDINKIEPNANQPRKDFNEDALQELSDSIKQHGLIEPIIVQEGKKGFYQIIAGERRWRAARQAGLKKIPVIVKDYTEQEIMEVALIENIQREDLNPIEEAEAFQRLIDEYHLKQDEVAEKVSKSRVAITNALRLLKLDPRVRRMVVEDKIKSGHARALLAIKDGDTQYETATEIFDTNLSVRDTEKLIKKMLAEPKKNKPDESEQDKQLQVIYQEYEEKLKTKLGTKVVINQKGNGKGKIEIEYYSADDFDRIIEFITRE